MQNISHLTDSYLNLDIAMFFLALKLFGCIVVSFAVNLSSDAEDKLKIYRENFEKAYLSATESFYKTKAPEYLADNGVQNFMKYADSKLKEEEQRARRYLETRAGCNSVSVVSVNEI